MGICKDRGDIFDIMENIAIRKRASGSGFVFRGFLFSGGYGCL